MHGFIENLSREIKILLIIIFIYILFSAAFYMNMGLSDDEGNYFFISKKFYEGHAPYKDYSAGDIKPPGNYYFIASLLGIMGRNMEMIRLVFFLVNSVSALLLFGLARKFMDKKKALMCSASFILLNILPVYDGYIMEPDRLLILFSLASIYLFRESIGKNNSMKYSMLIGIFIGMAATFKQTGAMLLIFVIFSAALLKIKKVGSYRMLNMVFILAGFLIPVSLVYAHFSYMGASQDLIRWVLIEPGNYYSGGTIFENPVSYLSVGILYTMVTLLPLWIFSAISFVLLVKKIFVKPNSNDIVLFSMFIASLYPFVLTLSYIQIFAVSLMLITFYFIDETTKFLKQKKSFRRTLYILFVSVIFVSSAALNVYSIHRTQEFTIGFYSEEISVSKYIKNVTSQNDKIYVLNYAPSIYFYSERDPPIGLSQTTLVMQHLRPGDLEETVTSLQENDIEYVVITSDAYNFSKTHLNYLVDFIEREYSPETRIGRFVIYKKNS